MICRIRSDREVAFARVSAVKAVLVRNSCLRGAPQEVSVGFNSETPDVAYRCGRIFAVLERAQEASVTEDSPEAKLNSTIKDQFFGAAATRPLLVLPRLLLLNSHHLRKLKDLNKRYFNRLLGSIMDSSSFEFPRLLTLEQQGQFIVGYFQQRQEFFKSKEQRDKDFQQQEAASDE